MNLQLFEKIKRWMPNPAKIIDKLVFSEPVLEQLASFEMKCITIFDIFCGAVYHDERVNKYFRRFFAIYHVASEAVTWICCTMYLNDLVKLDLRAVAFGIIPLFWGTMMDIHLLVFYYHRTTIKQILRFFYDDANQSTWIISEDTRDEKYRMINVKKWITRIVTCGGIALICNELFNDPAKQVRFFTKKPYGWKYLPVWCPFENIFAKKMMFLLADVIVVPEIVIHWSSALFCFVIVVGLHNKFVGLCVKLKESSEFIFKNFETLEKRQEESLSKFDPSIASFVVEELNEEKRQKMEIFHGDFVRFIKRYQQLKKVHQLVGKFLESYFSVSYCIIVTILVAEGYISIKLFSKSEAKYDIMVVTSIMFAVTSGLWFVSCVLGSLFKEEIEMFAEEAFFTPWYYLCPRRRKTVFTFLTIVQKPAEVRLLRIVPLEKDTFQGYLNSVYSNIQFVDVLQTKTNR